LYDLANTKHYTNTDWVHRSSVQTGRHTSSLAPPSAYLYWKSISKRLDNPGCWSKITRLKNYPTVTFLVILTDTSWRLTRCETKLRRPRLTPSTTWSNFKKHYCTKYIMDKKNNKKNYKTDISSMSILFEAFSSKGQKSAK